MIFSSIIKHLDKKILLAIVILTMSTHYATAQLIPDDDDDPISIGSVVKGPSPVDANTTHTYEYSDGLIHNSRSWLVTGGTVISESYTKFPTVYKASVQWGSGTFGSVKFISNNLIKGNKKVIINDSDGGGTLPPVLSNENYVYTITPKIATTNVSQLTNSNKLEQVTYFDGLGRPKQSIAVRAGGNQEDIITPIVYDDFGRQDKDYLPYSRSNSSLNYESSLIPDSNANGNIAPITDQYLTKYPNDFNGVDINPYSKKEFESSPLNRVLKQGAPGSDWAVGNNNDHTIKFDYQTNTSNEVPKFDVDFISDNTESPKLVLANSYYAPNQLYKTVTKDENWGTYDGKDHTTEEFKNKQGQVVLKRAYNYKKPHDTYYLYDDYGNLTYVLPPLAVDEAKFYEVGITRIPVNNFVTGGNPTGGMSFGIEKTGVNTYRFKVDIDFNNLENSTFKTGDLMDIPSITSYLGSFVWLGTLSRSESLPGGGYRYKYVYYLVINGKLRCYAGNYNSAGGSNDDLIFTNFNNTRITNLPDTLEGLTETETQANAQELLDKLCYQYKYDYRNRLVEKKIPGKGWEYIVYNKLDQPVMTQDANLRAQRKWLFTKYDAFGRIAYTGEMHFANYMPNRATLQNSVTLSTNSQYVSKVSSAQSIAGTNVYYTLKDVLFNDYISKIFTINYYDDYVFDKLQGNSEASYGITPTVSVKGLATGSKVRVLDTNDWITTVNYYDDKSRSIYTYSHNAYLGTTDKIKSKLDFQGLVEETTSGHEKIAIKDVFVYDHANRLLKQEQIINDNPIELISKNHYDELGQLVKKDVGNNEASPLQEVDYTYNIRGWLKRINNPNSGELGKDLFSFELNYNDLFGTRLYNGNISRMLWTTASDNANRQYYYYYDNLNRLRSSYFRLWRQNSRYSTSVSYDKNGNIQALYRRGAIVENPSIASNFGIMDNLSYEYDGNQLIKVTDYGNDTHGFKDGNTVGDDYEYDANGNMISDANKQITNIVYNHLNLPTKVVFENRDPLISRTPKAIKYFYDATGVKLKKTVHNFINITTTDYAGNYIYENNDLKFFSHPEGYVEPDGNGGYDYVYQYKDHLGNIRLSYTENTETQEEVVFSDGLESASGWDGSGNSWGHPISAFDSTFKRTGNYSGRLDRDAGDGNAWDTSTHSNDWVAIDIDKPTYYTMSAWMFLEDVNDNRAQLYLFMKTNEETGYNTAINLASTIVKGQWVKIEKSVLVQDNIDKLNIRITNRYDGKVWFDDVKITKGNASNAIIVEENNYYPFGLKHKGYNNNVSANVNSVAKKFKYQGQELAEELEYNMHEFQLRHYDATIGRFVTTDPYEQFMSPYVAMGNNPVVSFDPDGGQCFDANGNQITCPEGELYDEYRNNKDNRIDILPEVVVGGGESSSESTNSNVNTNKIYGVEVGMKIAPSMREMPDGFRRDLDEVTLNLFGTRSYRQGGIGSPIHHVDANGVVVEAAPRHNGAGSIGLIGGPSASITNIGFRGLVQNRNLMKLTHQQIVNAFKGTGLKVSGHAIKRLKDPRTQALGAKTLNDIKRIINKGSKFNAGRGDIGYSLGRLEVIITAQKVIRTIRPAKNIR